MVTAVIVANSVTGLQWSTGGTSVTTDADTTVVNQSNGGVYYWTENPSKKQRMGTTANFPQKDASVIYSFANNDGAAAPQITLTVTGKPSTEQ